MKHTHDLLVIGAGSAGLGCAGFAATIGLNAALIDTSAKNFGGDCLNYGCVPSKALLHVASLFQGGRDAVRFGLQTSGKADFRAVMDYVHGRQDVIRAHETPEAMREKYGVDAIVGRAELTGPNSLKVNGKELSAKRIILCTGSVPRKLDVPGVDGVRQWDNESIFWELDELPEHLLIVGGGPISCELAQAFRRLGSAVTLLVRGSSLLDKDPEKMGRILTRKLREEGVVIQFGTEVESFSSSTEAVLKVDAEKRGAAAGAMDGETGAPPRLKAEELTAVPDTLTFSHLLVAIGRDVRTEGIGLEAAGVEVQDGKIVTNDYYRTNVPSIYAIGDAYGAEMFSHGAEKHNTDLWTNLLSPVNLKKHRLDHFSWVAFTDPEIATFGLTKAQLDERGDDYEIVHQPRGGDDRAIAADYAYGHLVLYLSKGTFGGGKLLGGSMAAPAAGEMIQELHLLQTLGKKYSKLTNKIYAYPVGSRVNQKVARDRAGAFLRRGWVRSLLGGVYRLWG